MAMRILRQTGRRVREEVSENGTVLDTNAKEQVNASYAGRFGRFLQPVSQYAGFAGD